MRQLVSLINVVVMGCTLVAAQSVPTESTRTNKQTAPSANDPLPTETTVDAFLHQQFGFRSDVTWKISSIKPSQVAGLADVLVVLASPQGKQWIHFYVAKDGTQALVGEIIPFGARPFERAREALAKSATGPARGPKDARVTIVEFGDLQCPACKEQQPSIEALVAAEPNVRFVFQNFPLEMHNWAARGAAYADCVGRASDVAFWKFLSKNYEMQSDITVDNVDEKLTAIADAVGLKGPEIAACAGKPETKARVDASVALGNSLHVPGTPTLFVNGRMVGGFDAGLSDVYKSLPELGKSLVEFATKETK